jgi:magnesium chelatase accessory protein
LVSDKGHVNATLQMMAQWELDPLLASLPQSDMRGVLIAATNDRAVPYTVSRNMAAQMRNIDYVELPELGHLVHEEAAATVADPILVYLKKNAPD